MLNLEKLERPQRSEIIATDIFIREILWQDKVRLGVPKQISDAWTYLRTYYLQELPELDNKNRTYSYSFGENGVVMLIKQRDIVKALDRGAIDIGLMGIDEYWEAILAGKEFIRLGEIIPKAQCKFSLMIDKGESLDIEDLRARVSGGKIATSYPNLTRCLH